MKKARVIVVAIAWTASLLGVAVWAQGTRGAATTTPAQTAPMLSANDPVGPVLTGPDIGMQRLAGGPDRDGKIAVRWMVKVNGEWHEAVPAGPRIVR